MKLNKLLVVLSFLCLNAKAQVNTGPRITAMGGAGVALQDVWAAQKNQAGIALLTKPIASLAYENKFLIKEISTKSAVFAIPIKKYVLGASFQNYGINAYRETQSGLSLARAFGPKLLTAITVNYHQLQISNYGNTRAFSVQVGLQYQALPNLWLGAHVANPNSSKYAETTDLIIPAHIQFGGSYTFSDKLIISTELEKILDNKADFKTGIEYKIIKAFAIRGGVSMNPFKQYAGFGLALENLLVDFGISSHPILGYSPQISLGYEF
ncbi:MAG: hypothetical protein EAZ51_05210 [Sphingobacteriales bacterium]|nr:MAG: hypothetical protein EAZ64_03055 [Sphingobacteriales bacterium]TAF80852.1 MAG: hypothetical protein EAZ51_05210 [Sphingobacteriales bacterium]